MKLIISVLIICIALIVALRLFAPEKDAATEVKNDGDESALISSRGIHWHPTLKIFIRGEEVPIPPNIGLVGGHNPMHTHDADGVVHLEFQSVVREDDIRLKEFFELWNQPFDSEQVLEYTNTDDERVHMYVNGEEHFEFENYILRENDAVEIRFE